MQHILQAHQCSGRHKVFVNVSWGLFPQWICSITDVNKPSPKTAATHSRMWGAQLSCVPRHVPMVCRNVNKWVTWRKMVWGPSSQITLQRITLMHQSITSESRDGTKNVRIEDDYKVYFRQGSWCGSWPKTLQAPRNPKTGVKQQIQFWLHTEEPSPRVSQELIKMGEV